MSDRTVVYRTLFGENMSDSRLVCDWCGEIGTLVEKSGKFCVTCKGRDACDSGPVCCRTDWWTEKDEEIAKWQKMQDGEPLPEGL